ncbi:restriction endonuclease subunit S [Psychrobacter frigidicola]|uniref:Restriction endonuclease subunit S n=1 Tax=Psychrobacter frigidicola TaxID=45611 RepID=A0A5C7A109_9GAMM|nr:restriction endonuclease subunit S [Psychrobacter frigidicola]TXD96522.1 restriction endonuclease subunit S [Psychrobacter frigidicola]
MTELVTKYQEYAEYKDSGVEWLGEIPNHWEITALKRYCNVKGGYAFASDAFTDVGKPIIRIGDIKEDGSISLESCKFISTELAKSSHAYLVEKGQLLMAMTGATIGKAGVYISDSPAYLNQRVGKFVIDNDELNYGFLWYTLKTNGYQEYIKLTAFGGAQPNISDTGMVDYISCFPSLIEQTQIANFLDHETTQIDTLIEKQQTLIKLLKEKRQAVISHAVTKGLNFDAPMKDSGVEWLGEVPEYWEVKKNKHLLEFVTSGSRGWAGYYSDEGKLFFRITNLTRDTIEPKLESIQNVLPPLGAEGERSKIQLDDLLISITADLGSVCVANNSISGGFVSQHVSLCRPNSSVKSARWLAYFILSDSAKEQFVGSGYGGTKIQLSLEDIRELNIAYPPKKEQEDIASYIEVKLKKFELLMSQAEQAIQLMQERRTALISAAVTGKIDVRGWVVPE